MARAKRHTGTDAEDQNSTTAKIGLAATPRHILVAEDNEVTHDLLELLLSQRGHTVEIVNDGEQALSALQENEYDVVLMDFHLPKMDGLEVTAAFKALDRKDKTTRFVAITADMKGLLGHAADCENFDDVMAKPFNLEDVCKVVEGEADASILSTNARSPDELEAGPAKRSRPQLKAAPIAAAEARPTNELERTLLDLDYRFLRWPDDFNAQNMSARAHHASLNDGSFDAILITEAVTPEGLAPIWRSKALHLLPIIDLTGVLGKQADLDASGLRSINANKIGRLIEDFNRRKGQLHRDFIFSDEPDEKLLGRIFVGGEDLTPFYAPNNSRFTSYNTTLAASVAEQEAEKLCNTGFLTKTFFDRFHKCGRCSSSRFNIREECPDCRSPNLIEEPYLHHFKCAYQGLESDFRDGEDLICPKCRRELMHYSIDYDKPGTLIKCLSCNHTSSDPSIGLSCIDCGAHTDGDQAETRDVHAYQLTDRGLTVLEAGREALGQRNKPLQFSELPLELVVTVNSELKKYQTDETPFVVLDLSYRNARELENEHGTRQFQQTRDLFLENLRNLLAKGSPVIEGQSHDFAFIKETSPEDIRVHLKGLRKDAIDGLRLELDVAVSLYGPESFV